MGNILLLDFGKCYIFRSNPTSGGVSTSFTGRKSHGPLEYTAPEIIKEEDTEDKDEHYYFSGEFTMYFNFDRVLINGFFLSWFVADWWSFGIIIWELLFGSNPFRSNYVVSKKEIKSEF